MLIHVISYDLLNNSYKIETKDREGERERERGKIENGHVIPSAVLSYNSVVGLNIKWFVIDDDAYAII